LVVVGETGGTILLTIIQWKHFTIDFADDI